MSNASKSHNSLKTKTHLIHSGREPEDHFGFVNTPIYKGSTVLFPTVKALMANDQEYTYGRKGSPTSRHLEQAIANLEGGYKTYLTPSGLSAVTTAILSLVKAGDHILIADSVYQPTRKFCDLILTRMNVATTYYDPLIGENIQQLFRPNTKLVFTESPGSQTFEIQDVPAIAKSAKQRGIYVLMDNTWATPLYFKAFEKGVDVSILSATKYIIGHADAMLGAITTNERAHEQIQLGCHGLGVCAGPEDAYLGLRGLRTLSVRLQQHWQSSIEVAQWLETRPEVAHVLHPALASHPGHSLWKQDFLGATGLFSVILHPVSETALAQMLESLKLFGMGWSWGGFESLVIPFWPQHYRTATRWDHQGPGLRFHIGLEDVSDLISDLEQGFGHLHQ